MRPGTGSRLLPLALALIMAGCGGQPPAHAPESPVAVERQLPRNDARPRSVGERAAVIAVRQVGVPYRYGGNTVSGFDCSGLVQYAYASVGKSLPRTTTDLWRQTRPVRVNALEVGDVLFFDIEGKIAHVGLYLGDRRFVHAPASGREVSIEELDSAFYRQAFVRGGRP